MRLNHFAKSRGISLAEAKKLTGVSHHNKQVPEEFLEPGDGMEDLVQEAPKVEHVPETIEPFVPAEKPVVQNKVNKEPKKKAPEFRASGEKIRLARDGKDYGSNCLNRMHGT